MILEGNGVGGSPQSRKVNGVSQRFRSATKEANQTQHHRAESHGQPPLVSLAFGHKAYCGALKSMHRVATLGANGSRDETELEQLRSSLCCSEARCFVAPAPAR